MLQKMTEIREMQEKLTLKHFEIDQSKMAPETASGTAMGEDKEDEQLLELTRALEKLGSNIQSLLSKQPARKPGEKSTKRVSMKFNPDEQIHDSDS